MFVPLSPHFDKKGERTNSVMNFRRGGGLQEMITGTDPLILGNDHWNRPSDPPLVNWLLGSHTAARASEWNLDSGLSARLGTTQGQRVP